MRPDTRLVTLFALLGPMVTVVRGALALENAPALVERGIIAARQNAAAVGSSSYLQTIINGASSSCGAPCQTYVGALSACSKQTSEQAIAQCACNSDTLAQLRSCASCSATDKATARQNATSIVQAYNSFVDLCVTDGLAVVTGTVTAGQSTGAAVSGSAARTKTRSTVTALGTAQVPNANLATSAPSTTTAIVTPTTVKPNAAGQRTASSVLVALCAVGLALAVIA